MFFSDPLINEISPSPIPPITLNPYQYHHDFSSSLPLNKEEEKSFATVPDNYHEELDSQLGPYESRKHLNTAATSNPFESVSVMVIDANNRQRETNSIFINRAALKLANLLISSVSSFSSFSSGFPRGNPDEKEVIKRFPRGNPEEKEIKRFIDIAAGPGGFTQYLQYAYPQAVGYGITKTYQEGDTVNRSLNWRKEALDLTRFTPFYGSDGSGDILKHGVSFIHEVSKKGEVDLAVADGGMEDLKEDVMLPLLVAESYIACATLRKGGTYIVKFSTTTSPLTARLIYLLAMTFASIVFVKPLTSRQMNTEHYFIGNGFLKNATVLAALKSWYSNSFNPLIDPSVSRLKENFVVWLTQVNDRMCRLRRNMAERYIAIVKGMTFPPYANHKVLGLLGLPGPAYIEYPRAPSSF